MKGQPFHNQLCESLATGFELCGATVHREYPVTRGRNPRSVDALIQLGPHRWVLEVEQKPDRSGSDVLKAEALGAGALLIAAPNPRVVRAVKRHLKRILSSRSAPGLRITVLTFGAALQLVANRSQLMSSLLVSIQQDNRAPSTTVPIDATAPASESATAESRQRQPKRPRGVTGRRDIGRDRNLNPPPNP